MPWFYYSGKIPRSIPVRKGLSAVAAPHSKVEIHDVTNKQVQAMRRQGLLRPSGRPKGMQSTAPVSTKEELTVKDVTEKSAMARMVAEKGMTNDKKIAPTKKSGAPEMTDPELGIDEKNEEPEDASTKGGRKRGRPKNPEKKISGADVAEVLSKAAADNESTTDGDKE